MVLAVMGAMLPPIPPSTQQSCDCLSRREFLPSFRRNSRSAPYTVRSPTVPNGNQVAH